MYENAPPAATQTIADEPTVILPSVTSTYPLSAFAVPSSTNTKVPPVSSAAVFASADLAGVAPTT